MDYLGAVFIVIGFVFLIKRLALIENSGQVVSVARTAFAAINNPELSDEEKEEAVQQHALQLFKLFLVLTLSALAAVGLPVGIVWLGDASGVMSFDGVMKITLSVEFLVLTTVLVAAFFWAIRKR